MNQKERREKAKERWTRLRGEIWEERRHACQHCGRALKTPRAHNFAHLEHRGMGGGEERNEKDNVALLCYGCHYWLDNGVWPDNAEWMDQ